MSGRGNKINRDESKFNLKRAVKEDENGADAQKHAGFLNFSERNPGTVRVSTDNSKDEVLLGRCAVSRPATAVFRFHSRSLEAGLLDSMRATQFLRFSSLRKRDKTYP